MWFILFVLILLLLIKSKCYRTGKRVRFKTHVETENDYDVYGSLNCPRCHKLLKHLDSQKIDYRFIDVTTVRGKILFNRYNSDETIPLMIRKQTGEKIYGLI